MKKTLLYIVLAMIVITAVYMKLTGVHNPFSPQIKYVDGKPYEVIKHEIDTVDVIKTKTVYKQGKDIYHDTTIFVPVPMNVDTMEIIRQYFAKNIYKDTLRLPDSLGYVFLTDTITKNMIQGRVFTANVKQRTIKETTIVKELPKANIFWGIGAGFDKVNFVNHVQANLMLKTKCDRIYSIGAGVDINKVPFINTSVYWKIR